MGSPTMLDGRYRLGELIGSGGMADVYSAVDSRLGREVAIKLFHPKADGATVARLESEARLLGGLSHHGLVRVFDVAVDNDRPYLVMQLIDGGNLRAKLDGGVLGAGEVARIGVRLADILAYVHSRGIVHRDVKPSNILLDLDDACYLADFGIARALGGARLTSTGHCVGTAAYLAPEQVRGELTGPAGDVYSLGLVLLECLTGTPEYEGSDVEAALARLTRDPEIPDWLPAIWADTLGAMTTRVPEERPSATECGQRLAAAALVGPIVVPGPNATGRHARQDTTAKIEVRRTSRAVHASLVAGALMVGGVAAMLSTGASSAEPNPVQTAPVSNVSTSVLPTQAAPLPVKMATGVIEVPAVSTKVVTITRQATQTREPTSGDSRRGKHWRWPRGNRFEG
ncbi:serine/threonine-protein kinase [Actinokineospora sp. NBRC 105648]|uniref:serine/threonine-protein kinase n=1 Tax=Actinokineospora sp. NBRC 105648 TaxID=3032206 RepID=UPI0024A54DA8|nr:serine/threonine-protein kinase [Actinokineospora sp. NBRC 105648]GLZ36400.1 serine/threonine protein kinase [Actinokineospora sp. NBRC 105648]